MGRGLGLSIIEIKEERVQNCANLDENVDQKWQKKCFFFI